MGNIIKNIGGLKSDLLRRTQERLDSLTKPQGSLGRLEELAKQVVSIKGCENPSLKNKVIFTLAADHGVTEEGVSAYPKEVTVQMVYNFLNGGAGINVLARHAGARVVVVDMGVAEKINPSTMFRVDPERSRMGQKSPPQDMAGPPMAGKMQNFKDKKIGFGTKNMVKGPAMTKEEAIKSIEAGIELLEEELKKGVDIVGLGDMGIGNTTSSSAVTSCITGKEVETVTGRGTGIDPERLRHKIEVIKKALKINKPDFQDAIDVLSKVGGFEIGGMAGIMLAAAYHRIPVVVDGFISGAAALIAYTLQPKVKDFMIAAHSSVEKGHKIVFNHIGLKPLFDLQLRLGEGTGAALAMHIVEAGVKILQEMATFEDAEVSQRES